jgi:hypothetical protein
LNTTPFSLAPPYGNRALKKLQHAVSDANKSLSSLYAGRRGNYDMRRFIIYIIGKYNLDFRNEGVFI